MPAGMFKARGNVSLLKNLRCVWEAFGTFYADASGNVQVCWSLYIFHCGCRLCWLWTWKYLHLFNLYNARGGEIPKMCRRLVKTIQMNVRSLTSLRRLLWESWIFSCVTALVVRAIFSAVCSQYMERLREMCLDVILFIWLIFPSDYCLQCLV
ncbi:uncharacterized protein LOC122577441 isoform X3 [Bombus pyrosoma]|uniref:uncharacterized protein LOC122577441 isoform X3 n=1 Tax=Bombus pyrosoma TaxID=396416 RepID=UPI001CB93BA5|nr:uncharacterized protein LOC122577441 isoform X3 [Bombus pyrosoma]